jgi:DNA-binding NtrC family response regulator
MERTILLERGDEIRPELLALGAGAGTVSGSVTRTDGEAPSLGEALDAILHSPEFPPGGIAFEKLVEEIERQLILKAYAMSEENQSKTAEALNMKRDKLRYRMKQFGMKDEEPTTRVG